MRILDRYILKNFLVPFLYCFLGFISIWFAFDLADKMNEMVSTKMPFNVILKYYGTQLPGMVVIILPIALLLSLLYSLSRMSRSNEIISMLTTGWSLYRVALPLLVAGLAVAGLCFMMTYQLAPNAEPARKALLDSYKYLNVITMENELFRNRADNRTWMLQMKTDLHTPYLRSARPDQNILEAIHVTQQDKEGNILIKYYAHNAFYDAPNKLWVFSNGKTLTYSPDGGDPVEEKWDIKTFKGWSETPWRIFSVNLDAQNLSVPELKTYLRLNSDFPDDQLAPYRTYYYYRWAVPAACLIIVLIATPLGIVYSRRGVLAGVAGSIFIFFTMMFVDKLFLSLGKHGTIPPFLGAWGNNIVFGCIGMFLLYMRSNNIDIFTWSPKNLLRRFKKT